jgi:hypothetical protein
MNNVRTVLLSVAIVQLICVIGGVLICYSFHVVGAVRMVSMAN